MNWFKRRKLTDEEYVENIRKGLKQGKRLSWLYLLYAVAYFALAVAFIEWATEFAGTLQNITRDMGLTQDGAMSASFSMGASWGMLIGAGGTLFFAKAALQIWLFTYTRAGDRRNRLLVACFDEVRKSRSGSLNQPES